MDYVERTITFDMTVWVGNLESTEKSKRETRRSGVLIISDFDLCFIEAPDLRYPFAAPRPLTVESGSGNPQQLAFLEGIPEDAFAHWFFVREWNSFIYFVAREARFDSQNAIS